MSELMDLLRQAMRDASLANVVYRDPAFRAKMGREPGQAPRAFRVTSLPSGEQRPRELPRRWQPPRDGTRTRPVL